ncbi:tetratricopeptide repeat protein [Haloferula chungangensis]|uniref:Tetratricopeptide repeat protein n=1 Tax=Haloferula chungangensis TaxID=1048331 RepID=A0ABW2L9D4_9BACT
MLKQTWWAFALVMPLAADPKLDFARGVLEEARGNEGLEWFEKALAADPEAMSLVSRVGQGRFQAGDLEGASKVYRELAMARPDAVAAQVAYSDFLRMAAPNDDFAAKLATEALERALESSSGDAGVIQRLFRVYEQRGMRDESLALFDQVRKGEVSGGQSALLAADMARTLFPDDDAAVQTKLDEIFHQAMARGPTDPRLARAASEHFRKTGRLDEAVVMLEKHVEVAPSSLELRVRLGVLLLAAERMDEGEGVLKEVLEIDPRQALAHQALAKLYRKQERLDEARPHAAEVLKIRGGDADEFATLAEEFLEAGMAREARLLLEKGLYDFPEVAEIAVQLAIATRRDPQTRNEASRLFREAEALSGVDGPATQPEFMREFAECLLEEGKVTPAEDRLRAAIKAYPPEAKGEMAAAMRRLAEIWLAEGRNEAAAKALQKRADSLAK